MVIRPTTVMSSANLMVELELCEATQSWVYRKYRRRLKTHPCGAPVLRSSGEGDVAYLHHLHREEFSPRPVGIVVSLEGTVVLKAEL